VGSGAGLSRADNEAHAENIRRKLWAHSRGRIAAWVTGHRQALTASVVHPTSGLGTAIPSSEERRNCR
jgi:hypothetical protein